VRQPLRVQVVHGAQDLAHHAARNLLARAVARLLVQPAQHVAGGAQLQHHRHPLRQQRHAAEADDERVRRQHVVAQLSVEQRLQPRVVTARGRIF
jgi:hypothetical protein